MHIVSTNIDYNYLKMAKNLFTLSKVYPFLNIQVIGHSVLGKKIYAIRLGYGKKEVFYAGSFHANEWITSVLLMKFIEDYCTAYNNNSQLFDFSIRDLFSSTSIYIVPMVNPDGVDLVTNSLSSASSPYQNAKAIASKHPNIPFPNRMES